MPHNAELEFMDKSMLQASIELTHELDRAFNMTPKITMSQVTQHRSITLVLICCACHRSLKGLQKIAVVNMAVACLCREMFLGSLGRQFLFWWILGSKQ